MATYDVNDARYPQDDERFELQPDEMTMTQCALWLQNKPLSPEFCSGEDYKAFVARQTRYGAYSTAVTARRDELKLAEQKLNVPTPPVGDDIRASIDWIQATGITPLEFMVRTYRDQAVSMAQRISAAAKLLEYTNRKMPTQIEVDNKGAPVTAKQFDPVAIASLSEKELGVLERLLDKMTAVGS